MKSPFGKIIGMATWAITALASINIGLAAMGKDLIAMSPLASMATPVAYVIGVAGALSLAMMVMAITSGCCCSCGSN